MPLDPLPNMKVNCATRINIERRTMATKKTTSAADSIAAEKIVTEKAPRKSRAKKVEDTAPEAGILETIEQEGVAEDLTIVVKDVKRRKPSSRERGDDGKVVRKGRNLSGNQPFQHKHYFYDLDFAQGDVYDKAFQVAPMQVRLILKYMKETGITTNDDALIGADIAGGAINSGYLQSKIDPAALFAYYRRVMERLGLRLASSEELEEE